MSFEQKSCYATETHINLRLVKKTLAMFELKHLFYFYLAAPRWRCTSPRGTPRPPCARSCRRAPAGWPRLSWRRPAGGPHPWGGGQGRPETEFKKSYQTFTSANDRRVIAQRTPPQTEARPTKDGRNSSPPAMFFDWQRALL